MNFTEEQTPLIVTEDKAFSVVASAGSGKTRVLVSRYVRLVESGYRPEEILTITYTRKAAAEMKQRIVTALFDKGLEQAAQECETGPIQTIHSFCERLLRENAFYAGLDPKFRVSEGAVHTVRTEAALKAVLENHLEENPQWIDFLRARSGRGQYKTQTTLAGYLRQEIGSILTAIRGSNWTLADLTRSHSDPAHVLDNWKRTVMKECGMVMPLDTPFSLLAAEVKSALKSNKQSKPWLSAKVIDENEMYAAQEACFVAQLAAAVWEELERQMKKDQEFDFTLLERLAVDLLVTNEDVQKQTRTQYPVVLVDESQDVNPVQFRLLNALDPHSHVMVGDPQQSIYGFRLADRELFLSRMNTPGVSTFWLTRNFRVKEAGILRFVDRVFGALWSDSYRPMGETSFELDGPSQPMNGVELWPAPAKNNQALVAQNISSLLGEEVRPGDIAVLVRGRAYAIPLKSELDALGIPNLLVGGNESFFTRMEIHDLANALEALVNPGDALAVASLLRGPFVGLSTDAIFELTLQPVTLDRIRHMEGRNSRDHERIERFKGWYLELVEFADRLSAWEVCAELFARTDYLAAIAGEPIGSRTLANVRKLFVQATQQPDIGPAAFAAQIREVQRLRHTEPEAEQTDQDADAVKIMTVHKAKGLEFPVVVAPEFVRSNSRPFRGPAVDSRQGLIVAQKVGEYEPVVRRLLIDGHKRREAEEEERVFYVALTRAVHRLCLVVPTEPDKSLAGRASLQVGFPKSLEPGITVRIPSKQ